MTTTEPSGRIRGLTELVQAIPYLLEFRPAESLVLIGLNERGHIEITVRIDLDDVRADGVAVVADAVAKARSAGAGMFVAAVYTEQDDPGPVPLTVLSGDEELWDDRAVLDSTDWLAGSDIARLAEDAVACCGGVLLDAVLVRADRCWSYVCDDLCCPQSGRELPDAPSAFVATAVVAGRVVAPDRAARAALLDPLPADDPAALGPSITAAEDEAAVSASARQRHERAVRRALFAAARASDEPGWVPPGPAELARYAVALTSRDTRDRFWYEIEERTFDGRPLMCEIIRRCPPPYDVAALFLFGWASWRAGNGMLADLAATRALERDPGNEAAGLLHRAVVNGLDPHSVERLRRPRSTRRR